jgi:hypothetical protein
MKRPWKMKHYMLAGIALQKTIYQAVKSGVISERQGYRLNGDERFKKLLQDVRLCSSPPFNEDWSDVAEFWRRTGYPLPSGFLLTFTKGQLVRVWLDAHRIENALYDNEGKVRPGIPVLTQEFLENIVEHRLDEFPEVADMTNRTPTLPPIFEKGEEPNE